jgi:O-antigen/teichoic acid export membrane protein
VPHALAGWVLELSDRAILSRFVPLAEVGIYSLGYQVGAALGLVVVAFNNAWIPYLFKTLAAEGQDSDRRLARLASYFVMVLCFSGLGLALLLEPILRVLVTPAYLPAAAIAPWVVGANVMYGLYVIPIGLLFWKDQTKRIPIVTLAAGLVNVGLNLWLVPRHGTVAAAWSTLAAYAVMFLVAWYFAHRVRPFPYEYGRLVRTLAAAGALYGAGTLLPSSSALGVTGRVALWLAFPLCLAALGVFESREIAAFRALRWARVP